MVEVYDPYFLKIITMFSGQCLTYEMKSSLVFVLKILNVFETKNCPIECFRSIRIRTETRVVLAHRISRWSNPRLFHVRAAFPLQRYSRR